MGRWSDEAIKWSEKWCWDGHLVFSVLEPGALAFPSIQAGEFDLLPSQWEAVPVDFLSRVPLSQRFFLSDRDVSQRRPVAHRPLTYVRPSSLTSIDITVDASQKKELLVLLVFLTNLMSLRACEADDEPAVHCAVDPTAP